MTSVTTVIRAKPRVLEIFEKIERVVLSASIVADVVTFVCGQILKYTNIVEDSNACSTWAIRILASLAVYVWLRFVVTNAIEPLYFLRQRLIDDTLYQKYSKNEQLLVRILFLSTLVNLFFGSHDFKRFYAIAIVLAWLYLRNRADRLVGKQHTGLRTMFWFLLGTADISVI